MADPPGYVLTHSVGPRQVRRGLPCYLIDFRALGATENDWSTVPRQDPPALRRSHYAACRHFGMGIHRFILQGTARGTGDDFGPGHDRSRSQMSFKNPSLLFEKGKHTDLRRNWTSEGVVPF